MDFAQLQRFSVEAYRDLPRTGFFDERDPVDFFDERDPVELLDGYLVRKKSEDPIHAAVIYAVGDWLKEHLPEGYIVRGPAPITMAESVPEPDLCIARGRQLDYADHHPRPDEIVLLIEVANRSLSRDRGWKQRIYARAGTPEYWIVDLPSRTLEVYRDPETPADTEPRYATRKLHAADATVELPMPGLPPLDLATVFPKK